MQASGIVDIQAHGYSHAMMFCDDAIAGFVTPGYDPPVHLRPLLNASESWRYATPADLGCPLYAQRSRMSDARRYLESIAARERCMERVKTEGGPAFFLRRDWESELRKAAGEAGGRYETPAEQRRAIPAFRLAGRA